MSNYNELPPNLPIPTDDGAANHLKGMRLPQLALKATNGATIQLGEIKNKLVIVNLKSLNLIYLVSMKFING